MKQIKYTNTKWPYLNKFHAFFAAKKPENIKRTLVAVLDIRGTKKLQEKDFKMNVTNLQYSTKSRKFNFFRLRFFLALKQNPTLFRPMLDSKKLFLLDNIAVP